MATESLQARLTDFERQARGVCIGVNHLALDSERVRQAELLQKIIQLEKDIQQSSAQKSHLPDAAAEIRDDVKNNTAALRYLETISQLENSFTVLTENVTETSVQLSAPKELKDEVHVKKELSSNVKSCWTYVSQLARLSQVHIRNAAEYHQFHHAVSEVEASLKARVRMTEPKSVRVLSPSLKNCTILANELREHLNHMIHLWGRSGNLLEESRRIVPVHLRLGGVVDGLSTNTESPNPVMARMLTSLTGPNYELKEGEEVRVISNKDDQHFWTVQTNNGIVKIPSVCLWISDPDLEAVKRAVILREKCIESWDLLVERSRERLRSYYARLLNNMAENGDIQYNHKTAMDNFLEDLRGLLLPGDNRTSELGQAMYAFTDRLKMTDISRQRSSSHGEINLREQDIVCMHSPLLRLRDHERQLENLRAQSEMIGTHMTNYLREIDADQKRVDNELSLIDQLQHESQSQLDQLISRVKRWSSRFEHEPNVDSSITNSRMSSSLKSSTISDNWTGNVIYPPDTRSPRSTVRETSRLSSSTRSESIPRPVLDAITQIGVTSRTIGIQSSDGIGGETDLLMSKGRFTSATNPQRKQVRNAITQIGVSKVDTGTQDDYHAYSPKRAVKEVLCQIGQVTANASCQTLEYYKPQQILKKCTLDAIVQSGVITKNSSTQSEVAKETIVKMDPLESQYAARKYSLLDTICQVGQVTQNTGTQIDARATERNKKNYGVQVEIRVSSQQAVRTTEAACQIGRRTMNASTETLQMTTSKETVTKTDMRKSDIICQIGNVQATTSTQTTETEIYRTEKIKDAIQQCEILKSPASSQVGIATTKLVAKSVNDVICQVGQVKNEVSTQSVEHTTTKPACRNIGVDPIGLLEKKVTTDVITQTGIVHTSKIIQAELIQEQPVYVKAIETQDAPITSYKDTSDVYQQADLIRQMLRKPTTDVVCQVGNVMETTGMQIDEVHKTRISLAGTQSIKTATHHKEIQADTGFRVESKFIPKAVNDVICQVGQVKNEVSTQSVEHTTTKPACRNIGVDPIGLLEKKVTTDVITQTGIVHTSKIIQAELIQEQPVYVKAIETQDAPITSYKDTSDAYQQADLIRQMLRKPTTDVVCQVGNVMETTGMQIDEVHKTRISLAGTQSIKTATHHKEIQADTGFRVESKFIPKAVNDVICQVGQVKNEVSTQSVEHTTTKPACRNIGVDPIGLLEKKVTTDVITQTGIVHTSKIIQAELIQEQPVYVKAIETQDVPVSVCKGHSDKYQQAEFVKDTTKRSLADVVCQVGNVFENSASQTDVEYKKQSFSVGTESMVTSKTELRYQYQPSKSPVSVQVDKIKSIVKRSTSCFDLVTQCGIVNVTKSTQTTEIMREIQREIVKPHFDVVMQTGIMMKTEGTMTKVEAADEIPLMTSVGVDPKPEATVRDVGSYKEPQSKEGQSRHVQVDIRPKLKHRDIQTEVITRETVISSNMIKAKPIKWIDVMTQAGVITQEVELSTQHEKRPEPTVHKKLQAIVQTPTVSTDTQTVEERPPPPEIPRKSFDVQTQSGTQHEKRPEPTVHKKLQAIVQTPTVSTDTQTVEERPPPPEIPRKSFDVQTQSGTQHEKRPEPTVHKKLQAIVQTPTVSTDTQTVEERPPPPEIPRKSFDVQTQSGTDTQTVEERPPPPEIPRKSFDVQTQSGVVKINSETQTLIETKTISNIMDASVRHEPYQIQTVNKKLQAMITHPSDDACLQTEELITSDVRPKIQTVLRTPQVDHKQTQAEYATAAMKSFDIQTQSGTHEETKISTVNEGIQVDFRHSISHRDVQSDEKTLMQKHQMDVQVQSGITYKEQAAQTPLEATTRVGTTEVSVTHKRKIRPINKKLQAIIQPSMKGIYTQTEMEGKSEPTTVSKDKYDAQTQSGSVKVDSNTQTPQERRSVVEMKELSTQHEKRPEPTVHKKLQAIVQTPTVSTDTQTVEERPPPPEIPRKSFDVQTQSGVVKSNSETQTLIETKTISNIMDASVRHEPYQIQTVNKKLQAMITHPSDDACLQTEELITSDVRPKIQTVLRTPQVDHKQTQAEYATAAMKSFDIQTQSGTTPYIECLKEMKDSVWDNTNFVGIQTDRTMDVLLYKSDETFKWDAQTESGISFKDSTIQTVDFKGTMKTVGHKVDERMSFDVQVQTGIMTNYSSVQTSEFHPTLYVTSSSCQIVDETSIEAATNKRVPHSTTLKNKKLQVSPSLTDTTAQVERYQDLGLTAIKSTKHTMQTISHFTQTTPMPNYDIQIQSGVINSTDGTQTVDLSPVTETKEMSVTHEKEPAVLKGKKLQVRCDLTDLAVQTEQTTPTIQPTISSTIHTVPITSQYTQTTQRCLTDTFCQATLSSNTYDVQIQSGLIHSTDGTQTVDLSPIQSGLIHSTDGTQTVDLSPVTETKEMSVTHEKEPAVLKGKKLQVRCDLTDLAVQTEQTTPTIQPTISSTIHTVPITSQYTQTTQRCLTDTFCQATLSSNTYDVQIQSGLIHSTDGTQTVD
ncbi:hypothetical protein MN116_002097 [Schistosoma mekongi]|uniref:Desmoplakin SH3 domain-containing protein n=1 Tax=Schistosoma mekongi TaxID=38744 RepID=A0AAE1ZKS1_SCHME|nr:hypothetical protein MN116_002097 [Schistosoma mekongi]